MTLEHIRTPYPFIGAAVQLVRQPGGVIFIQVPESLRILRDCAFEDIYYEHCSYFSAGSLGRLFQRLGFEVQRMEVEYDAQYLTVEAVPAAGVDAPLPAGFDDLDELRALVETFRERTRRKMLAWSGRLQSWASAGRKVVLWGSGSKAVSFLTTVPGADTVRHVVDINPYRHGYHMPLTGQRIAAPRELEAQRPDVVVVMNRIYVPEIRQQLDGMGLHPEILAL
jgi:hypothetical protein